MLLRADDVSFAYGTAPVLRAVTLEIGAGARLAVIGPNGTGKTTLLRLLAGLLRPAGGQVTLDGLEVGRLPRAQLARRIAVVPQETHLAFDYSVLEIALMGRYVHLPALALEGPRDIAIADAALAATDVAHLADRPFMTLSGGEKQRVIIASALAQLSVQPHLSPDQSAVLLLDEPTASLDLGHQLDVERTLVDLSARGRLGVVIATHDLNFAARVCDELVLLKDGAVFAQGPPAEVLVPRVVRDLYGVDIDVLTHPDRPYPIVVPLARERGAQVPRRNLS